MSKEGGLEYVILKEVQRRFLRNDPEENPSKEIKVGYYDIPGHILVLPNSDIINLNFSYYKLQKSEEEYTVTLVS